MIRELLRLKPDERHAYLRAERLVHALENDRVVGKLLAHLHAQLAHPSRISAEEKVEALLEHAASLGGAHRGPWAGMTWQEVIVVSLREVGHDCFDAVPAHKDETALRPAVARFLQHEGYEVEKEMPLGSKRTDVLGWRMSRRGRGERPEFVAVELKNDRKAFDRGLAQLKTYARYVHLVFLACTPQFAVDYLRHEQKAHGSSGWSPAALEEMLYPQFGLLVVEGNEVHPVHRAQDNKPGSAELAFLEQRLAARSR